MHECRIESNVCKTSPASLCTYIIDRTTLGITLRHTGIEPDSFHVYRIGRQFFNHLIIPNDVFNNGDCVEGVRIIVEELLLINSS